MSGTFCDLGANTAHEAGIQFDSSHSLCYGWGGKCTAVDPHRHVCPKCAIGSSAVVEPTVVGTRPRVHATQCADYASQILGDVDDKESVDSGNGMGVMKKRGGPPWQPSPWGVLSGANHATVCL